MSPKDKNAKEDAETFEDLLERTLPKKGSAAPVDLGAWEAYKQGVIPLAPRPERQAPPTSPEDPFSQRARASSRPGPFGEPTHALEPGTLPFYDSSCLSSSALSPLQGSRQQRRRRRRALPEATLDLHGMTQKEAYTALSRFIQRARLHGLRTVRVITGKGGGSKRSASGPRGFSDPFDDPPYTQEFSSGGPSQGILRQVFPGWVGTPPLSSEIADFTPARSKDGGDGAWYLFLKP